jgi:hypothetical protein
MAHDTSTPLFALDIFQQIRELPNTRDGVPTIREQAYLFYDMFNTAGILFGISDEAEDIIVRCSDGAGTEFSKDELAFGYFINELIRDTPSRFLELLRWDALFVCETQMGGAVTWVQAQTQRERLEHMARRRDRLLAVLETAPITRTRTGERFYVDIERYQENDEACVRFVMTHRTMSSNNDRV